MKNTEKFFRYKIDVEVVVKNTNIKFKPNLLRSIVMDCDYFNMFLPKFALKASFFMEHLDYFVQHERDMVCTLKITEMVSMDEEFKRCDNTVIYENVFMMIYDKNKIPKNMASAKKLKHNPADDSVELEYDETKMIRVAAFDLECFLWSSEELKLKKEIFNRVLAKKSGVENNLITVSEAIVSLINLSKHTERALIDVPDNKTGYNQIIILPYNLPQSLDSLQIRYGVYKNGLVSFFNNGKLFILKKYDSEHVHEKNSIHSVLLDLMQDESVAGQQIGRVSNRESTRSTYVRSSAISSSENEVASSEIIGDRFVFSNLSTVSNSVKFKQDKIYFESPLRCLENPFSKSHSESGVKIVSDYDEINNPFTVNEYIKSVNNRPISVGINNIRFSDFEPDKQIIIKCKRAELQNRFGGEYQIQQATFLFMFSNADPEKNKMCDCNVSLVLTRDSANITEKFSDLDH